MHGPAFAGIPIPRQMRVVLPIMIPYKPWNFIENFISDPKINKEFKQKWDPIVYRYINSLALGAAQNDR